MTPTPTPEPSTNPTANPAVQPESSTTTTPTAERETIVVTKVIEVFVEEDAAESSDDSSTVLSAEGQAEADRLTVEQKKEEDRETLLIAIPAAIVGLLVIVSCIMIIRCVTRNKTNKTAVVGIKTKVVDIDVEPQFVMEDDGKNIFARPSTAPMNVAGDIEGSDAKKSISRANHKINL